MFLSSILSVEDGRASDRDGQIGRRSLSVDAELRASARDRATSFLLERGSVSLAAGLVSQVSIRQESGGGVIWILEEDTEDDQLDKQEAEQASYHSEQQS